MMCKLRTAIVAMMVAVFSVLCVPQAYAFDQSGWVWMYSTPDFGLFYYKYMTNVWEAGGKKYFQIWVRYIYDDAYSMRVYGKYFPDGKYPKEQCVLVDFCIPDQLGRYHSSFFYDANGRLLMSRHRPATWDVIPPDTIIHDIYSVALAMAYNKVFPDKQQPLPDFSFRRKQ